MIEHLIYDFDGTIADSYPLFMRFLYQIAEKYHIVVPCDRETLYRAIKKTGYDGYLALECGDVLDYSTFQSEFHALQEQARNEFPIFPEAKELLYRATRAGKKNYLYTHTGAVVKQMLEHLGVLDAFTFILDSSYGFPLKPAPNALLYLAGELSLNPSECLMIGDRPLDAHAGIAAGMKGCLWDAEGLFPDAKVDYRVKNLIQIADIVGI